MEPARKTDVADIDFDLLPQSLCEIVEVVGLAAAMKIVEHQGGRRLWVPAAVADDHPIVRWIGREAADRLCRRFGAGSITVPKGASALRQVRNYSICARFAAGVTAGVLAAEHGVTETRIYQIVAASNGDGETGC